MFPAAFVCPRSETRYGRFGDDIKRSPFAHMPRCSVKSIKQMSAAWTGQLAFGPIHETVQDERVMRSEQFGHLHFLRHAVLPIRSKT